MLFGSFVASFYVGLDQSLHAKREIYAFEISDCCNNFVASVSVILFTFTVALHADKTQLECMQSLFALTSLKPFR